MADDEVKTASVTKLSLALSLLSLLEKILPAFLLAWNNALQQKNAALTVKLAQAKLDTTVLKFKAAEKAQNDQKTSKDIIDDLLSESSSASGDTDASGSKPVP